MQKRMAVEPENQEDGLDKDGEAGEVWCLVNPQAQQATLWENPGDSLNDVTFSQFQLVWPTPLLEMTQFKMWCRKYDPLWLISRLNNALLNVKNWVGKCCQLSAVSMVVLPCNNNKNEKKQFKNHSRNEV